MGTKNEPKDVLKKRKKTKENGHVKHVDTIREAKFLAISQLNFPEHSRDYLMRLVKDVASREGVHWVIVAGGLLAGKYLEDLLKSEYKTNMVRGEDDKVAYREWFVDHWATELDKFLPVLDNDVNYHIVSSPIYDATSENGVGKEILLSLISRRKDIRLYLDDTEPRMPLQWPKPTEIRILVPQHRGWYSKYVSRLLQRLAEPFINRTFSNRPAMILAGCTGSGVTIPSFKGIATLSVPACHKINRVRTTESMVGCLVVTMRQEKGKNTSSVDTFDFRPFVGAERQSLIPEDIAPEKGRVLWHLSQNAQGFDTLHSRLYGFRLDTKTPEKIEEEKEQLKKHLDALIAGNLVVYKPEINRYELSKALAYDVKVDLKTSMERAKRISVVAYACLHVGAIKTLYKTFTHYIPRIAEDADALVGCGDIIQGLAHNFEYSGEIVPTLNAYDRQSLKAGQIHANVLLQIFDRRFAKYASQAKNPQELIEKCLIKFIYCLGNHDMWSHYQKQGLPLFDFHKEIVSLLVSGIAERVADVPYKKLLALVEEKVIRVGENEIVKLNDIGIGVTHPHKGGADSKSARTQQVIEGHVARKHPKDVTLELVGNFHTAAGIHFPQYNRTYVGIMLGAMLKDTLFERKINKVVDHGPVMVTVWVDPRTGNLLKDRIEFFDDVMHPVDRRVVEADKLMESTVVGVAKRLTDYGDLPWR